MRIQSFENMEFEYSSVTRGLDFEDLKERKILLEKYKFSVIIEGEYSELDNLEDWVRENEEDDKFENIYYGKTEYNYGFVEHFVSEKKFDERLRITVPNIFTTYPNAYPSIQISKTDGYNTTLTYHSSNRDGIILP